MRNNVVRDPPAYRGVILLDPAESQGCVREHMTHPVLSPLSVCEKQRGATPGKDERVQSTFLLCRTTAPALPHGTSGDH